MNRSLAFQIEMDEPYEKSIESVTAALKREGFGVLTHIDVKETMKNKLDVDFRRYSILGACNPPLAKRALDSDPLIGLLLPCNVTVEENGDGSLVSILNPDTLLKFDEFQGNYEIAGVANEARERMERVVRALQS